ncbi:MAG: hypothetical protein NTV88_01285, partial [Candidatus Micrarchaeota archaeon]|nr:hypothetical protein [Candidatus Micrarchaeota archaeon]
TRKGVLRKISRVCHCSVTQAQTYLFFLEPLAKEHPSEITALYGFEEDELFFVSKAKPKKEKIVKVAKAKADKPVAAKKKKEKEKTAETLS